MYIRNVLEYHTMGTEKRKLGLINLTMQLGVKNQKTNNYHDVMTRVLKDEFDGKLLATIDNIVDDFAPATAEPKYYETIEEGLPHILNQFITTSI